jgi:phosphatidylinositol alpha-mannosyltransferase
VRIALVSPYSWTYPGGVTRHIEALAAELAGADHDVRVLAPFDPDDVVSRRLHRGARPQACEQPPNLISLGRTIGLSANGAVSNIALTPTAVFALRRELRGGCYDVVHIHEPVAPIAGWDAMGCVPDVPLLGTFHSFSENVLSNGTASLLGARRRMNRLHVRIAVSEAAAWTARRFYGGRYRIVPNGVHLDATASAERAPGGEDASPRPLRIAFVGAAVERKGLPVLLRAFEALREQVDATLTLVGVEQGDVAPLLLDDRGVQALGKVGDERKHALLAQADVLCAPSLGGESFGMVLTEAFAAGTPVVASDIPGYRDVVRDGVDALLTPAGDALALAQALRELALDPGRRAGMADAARERAERFAWPHVAAEVLDCYEQAIAVGDARTRLHRAAVRHGLAPADLRPAVGARRLPSLQPQPTSEQRAPLLALLRRFGFVAISLAGVALALLALARIGVDRVLASLVASSPGLIAAGLALMCASMVARGFAWHAILAAWASPRAR